MNDGLKVWTNGTDTYVARDMAHLADLVQRQTGYSLDSDMNSGDAGSWSEVTCATLTIRDEDRPGKKTTKTPAQWALDEGAGFLCSTEI